MTRTALLLTTLAALAAPFDAALAAGTSAVPTLGAEVVRCETGLELGERAADFSAAMPAIDGSSVLAMRFDLKQRRGGTWRPVAVPRAGRWERSARGAAGFVFDKRVERLVAGVTYRMTVRFRWYAADRRIVKRETRRSGTCRPSDLRPNLAVAGPGTAEPLTDGRSRYVVRVRNDGSTATLGTLRVGLAVDGAAVAAQALPGLAAAAVGSAVFVGPACRPGGEVRVVVDPQDDVDEADESDNALTMRC